MSDTAPQPADDSGEASLLRTPLYALHEELGARMVPFAGYAMPVQYARGILEEHLHTRAAAGLFDVSHMGQLRIVGDDPAAALETLVPGNIKGLPVGRMRYTQLTNHEGGIIDDLMVTRFADHLFLVVNAGPKKRDIAHLEAHLPPHYELELVGDRALIALQGPRAAEVLARHSVDTGSLHFMSATVAAVGGFECYVSRSGYTGEDGFEISVAGHEAEALARLLLAEDEVEPIGLGARDSLRLEAGLCLSGQDIDETTTPVEAALSWSIGKRRRREGGFPGAQVIQRQLAGGPLRLRVGILPDGRAPARYGAGIRSSVGEEIGMVTSGGYGPSISRPLAMGYVKAPFASAGTAITVVVRGRERPAKVSAMPFVPHGYVTASG